MSNHDQLVSMIKSAVKALRGESFDVYDTTDTVITFGFRAWDIAKEFEDQDDEQTNAVIAKFQRKILSYTGLPAEQLSLWQGDKNYLEGELTLTPAAAKV